MGQRHQHQPNWGISHHAVSFTADGTAGDRRYDYQHWLLVQNGTPANASYAASKGGLCGLTHMIAQQHTNSSIKALLIVLGYVPTRLTADIPQRASKALIDFCPLRRASSPSEIARTVLAVASRELDLANGSELYVTGGLFSIPI